MVTPLLTIYVTGQNKIQVNKIFLTYSRLIPNFFCLLALIINELGLGDKENWESTQLGWKISTNIFLTCNIYVAVNFLFQLIFIFPLF